MGKIKKDFKALEEIKNRVKKAYNKLPTGYKNRAAFIHGTSLNYFGRVCNDGEAKNIDVYYSALNAIKQAAKDYLDKMKAISEIEVNQPEEVK